LLFCYDFIIEVGYEVFGCYLSYLPLMMPLAVGVATCHACITRLCKTGKVIIQN